MGKVVVLVVLILAGFFALAAEAPAPGDLVARFRPFFTEGFTGLLQAMGYTFIALQGFDLIAAVGGEVRDAERNIPKAMFLSLGIALVIFLPLLFLIVAVGVPGGTVTELAAENPEILVAVAARNFMGSAGYWLVVAAGLLSMLSALQVNLIAASRFAQAMATDRTLPQRYARLTSATGTPTAAVRLTAVVAAFLLVAVPNVAAAGAASSLVFLGSFALTHTIAYLARKRAGRPLSFHTPWFPAIPIAGGSACMLIGLYQAVAVPSAGVLAALWLSAGAILYALYLGPRGAGGRRVLRGAGSPAHQAAGTPPRSCSRPSPTRPAPRRWWRWPRRSRRPTWPASSCSRWWNGRKGPERMFWRGASATHRRSWAGP